jgi:hypothetical protein
MNANMQNPKADWRIWKDDKGLNIPDRNFLASYRISLSPLGSLCRCLKKSRRENEQPRNG